MFESLIESIALYRVETWEWQYKDRLDRIKRKYVKWILELNRGTPNYILLEETMIREIKMKAIRAIRYEEKSRNTSKKLVHECIKRSGERKTGRRRRKVGEEEKRTVGKSRSK